MDVHVLSFKNFELISGDITAFVSSEDHAAGSFADLKFKALTSRGCFRFHYFLQGSLIWRFSVLVGNQVIYNKPATGK